MREFLQQHAISVSGLLCVVVTCEFDSRSHGLLVMCSIDVLQQIRIPHCSLYSFSQQNTAGQRAHALLNQRLGARDISGTDRAGDSYLDVVRKGHTAAHVGYTDASERYALRKISPRSRKDSGERVWREKSREEKVGVCFWR
jgi:hypothetical protein